MRIFINPLQILQICQEVPWRDNGTDINTPEEPEGRERTTHRVALLLLLLLLPPTANKQGQITATGVYANATVTNNTGMLFGSIWFCYQPCTGRFLPKLSH